MDLHSIGKIIKDSKEQLYKPKPIVNTSQKNNSTNEDVEDFRNTDRSDITSLVSSAYKTIDTLALYAREKSDSVIEMLTKVSPDEMCDFNTKNGVFMLNLMHLNEKEKEITLKALGVDAAFNGDSHVITAAAQSPRYAENINYKDKFVRELEKDKDSEKTRKYVGKPSPYGEVVNLYPDDDGTGKFTQKWNTKNVNSILSKTKKLFNQHKINTIISRFKTSPNTPTDEKDSKTVFGLSHGRNLLTASAERGEGSYGRNGYDNPYCRVWTHHYQYDRLDKLIRPFTAKDENGVFNPVAVEEFHKWDKFKDENKEGWSWKKDNDAWKYSVMGENGFVNIVPKFKGGGPNNLHTKQCMFSIENLAWRDYDPYSFEKNLSWEQRGPMGGRIMWFPPYGLQFTENVTAQWQNNTFIGRGEDIYTYANTIRSGTLNFMMLVDHPSIVDYVSRAGKNQDGSGKVSDTDMHRFFAGCDDMAGSGGSNKEGGKLSDYAVPTPLTDEYVEKRNGTNKTPTAKGKKKNTEIPYEESGDKIIFYVFYPNNYSGVDDSNTISESNVNAIAYLLYGKGSQCKGSLEDSVPLSFDSVVNNEYYGGGYEMSSPMGPTNEKDIPKTEYFIQGNGTKWYYRIDKLTTDQKITKNDKVVDKIDTVCNNLNSSAEKVADAFSIKDENEKAKLYSFAEVAYFLCENEELKKKIDANINGGIQEDRISKIQEVFKNKKITTVKIEGYSSIDDKNKEKHSERNERLAKERGNTIANWLKNNKRFEGLGDKIDVTPHSEVTDSGKKPNSNGDNGFDSKKYRSTKIIIEFNSESTEKTSEADQKPKADGVDVIKMADDVQKGIRKKYVVYSEQTAEEKKQETLEGVIENFVNNGNYTESMRDSLRSIKDVFDVTVEHAPFIIEDSEFEHLKQLLMNGNIIDKAMKTFETQEDFENTLGNELRETIKKLSDVKDMVERFDKDIKECNKLALKNLEIGTAIEELKKEKKEIENKKVDNEAQIEELEKQIANFENDIKRLENLKGEYEKIVNSNKDGKVNGLDVSVKDAKHEFDKLKNKIDVINKNKEKLKDKKDLLINENGTTEKDGELDKKIKEIDNKITKLSEQLKNTETNGILKQVNEITLNEKENIEPIKKTVKGYIKKNSDVDEYYLDKISGDFTNKVLNTAKVFVKYKPLSEEKIDTIVETVFSGDTYKVYNDLISQHTDEEDRTTVISDESLKTVFMNIAFKFNGKKEDENLFSINCNNSIKSTIDDKPWKGSLNMSDSYINTPNNDYQLSFDKKRFGYSYINFDDQWIKKMTENLNSNKVVEDIDWESFKNILDEALNVHMWLYYGEIDDDKLSELEQQVTDKIKNIQENLDKSDYVGFSKHIDPETKKEYYINENETIPSRKNQRWYLVNGKMVLEYVEGIYGRSEEMEYRPDNVKGYSNEYNNLRYDQEYHFFRILKEKDRITYDKLMDKIQYFNPAYHSMTPEGFSARLTFLQQCMRQGNTKTASDYNAAAANNLAFGRPPYCMLRLGDFYNQMIVIDNISISYDPLVWDLNSEGVGVIPLLANVSMSFKFIGGSSMYGAVNRLQNAMTFNYYANTNLYDNRADRPKYKWDDKTNGALPDNRALINDKSYFHSTSNYKPVKQ